MKKVILKIDGMTCSACSSGLEKYLKKQKGVLDATVNLVMAQAMITYEENLTVTDLERFVEEAGFESLGEDFGLQEKKKKKKGIFVFYGILTLFVLYLSMGEMLGLSSIFFLDKMTHAKSYALVLLFFTLLFFFYGRDIFQSGIKNAIHKTFNMDTLVSLGVFASFGYSLFHTILILMGHTMYVEELYYESCVVILYFIKLGRYIDQKSKEKTTEAISELVQITPSRATLKKDGKEYEVTLDEIRKKDVLVCRPGQKIAVDGRVLKGEAHCDESFLTGESMPVKKLPKDKVIAGSMNLDGYLEYEAERIGKESTISEVVQLVVEATNTKAPIQRVADFVSSIFVPMVLILAFLTFVVSLLFHAPLSDAITSFVTILVVACPCALGLATPLAVVVSEGLCAKQGILVKNSEILENAHKVDTIVFDKTGTLTYGNLKVSTIINYKDKNDKALLQKVASIEKNSTHPIGNAFLLAASEQKIKLLSVEKFENIAGMGIKALLDGKEYFIGNHKILSEKNMKNIHQEEEETLAKEGNSIVYVVEEKEIIALIGVKDVLRENAKSTIEALKKEGKEILLLTGDNQKTAEQVAKAVGITKVVANVVPKEKTKVIKELMKKGKKVMMVGDGINDAPSLATSDIGVSMNSGTDIAMNSSDVVLMKDNLSKIKALISISKKTLRIIKQNLFWAFFYNAGMIPIAMGIFKPWGLSVNPMIAGIAMTCSSFTVILNTLRLKNWKE